MSGGKASKNKFCDINDLDNESDVEQAFARRLLESLGYPDRAIRTKATLESLSVGKAAGDQHKPDFALKSSGHIRWILEAKHPNENLTNHVEQARGYCDAINTSYAPPGPVTNFVLTNALSTEVYRVSMGSRSCLSISLISWTVTIATRHSNRGCAPTSSRPSQHTTMQPTYCGSVSRASPK